MRTVTILCGIPGAGKSTLRAHTYAGVPVCSADDYFVEDGVYRFDPSKLPAAHAACLRRFVYLLTERQEDITDIVVDNTNTTVAEIAPYAALALAYGYTLDIVTVECDPEVAFTRQTHGVPLAAIQAMAKRLSARDLPPWWPHRRVVGDFSGVTSAPE